MGNAEGAATEVGPPKGAPSSTTSQKATPLMAKSTTYGSSTSVVSPSFAAAHHQGAQGRGRPNSPSEASGGGVSEHVLVTPEISSSPPSSSSSYNILGPGVGASLAARS